MDDIKQIFFEESFEMVSQMEQVLLSGANTNSSEAPINVLFRYAHSIKGSSGVMGFTKIAKFTHGLENALDKIRSSNIEMSAAFITLMLQAVDILRSMLITAKEIGDQEEPLCEQLIKAINQNTSQIDTEIRSNETSSQSKKIDKQFDICFTSSEQIYYEQLWSELGEYAEVISINKAANGGQKRDEWHLVIATDRDPALIRAVLELSSEGSIAIITPHNKLQTESTPEISAAPIVTKQTEAAENSTIRIKAKKVDSLFDLVNELVISHGSREIVESKTDAENEETENLARRLYDLHDKVMAVRMVPVGSVFQRFGRLVRDYSISQGKQIKLELEGEETELDRSLLEALSDPMTHLIRNSLDHGIETSDARIAAGKSAEGTVKLIARYADSRVIIEVSDDGKGINPAAIRKKAASLGLIKPDVKLTDEETFALLFKAGFTTAEKVSDLSGRGVGMDVVKRNIESLGGIVTIQSEEGKGTKIILSVPLTMAMLDALQVTVGDHHYLFPSNSIMEVYGAENLPQITKLHKKSVVNLKGEITPIVPLSDLLKIKPINAISPYYLRLKTDFSQYLLMVDKIIGQRTVVMKSLEANFIRVKPFSGAAVLNDGKIALIIDPINLSELIAERGSESIAA